MPTPHVATPTEKAGMGALWDTRGACADAGCSVEVRVETDTVRGATSLHLYHGAAHLAVPISDRVKRDGDAGEEIARAVRKWARSQHPTPLWVPHTVPQ